MMTTDGLDAPTLRTIQGAQPNAKLAAVEAGDEPLWARDGVLEKADVQTLKVFPNPRSVYTPESIEELAASIRKFGQIQPGVARRTKDGLELIVGTRRRRALTHLSEKFPGRYLTMDVVVRDIPDDAIGAIQFIENDSRESLTPVETAAHVVTLRETLKVPDAEIMKKLGWSSKRMLEMYVAIAQAPDGLKMYANPQPYEVAKLDKAGQAVKDEQGKKVMVQSKTPSAPLGASHLYELAMFFVAAEKAEAAKRRLDNEYRPVAMTTLTRLAKAAAQGEWNRAKLKDRIAAELEKITGVPSSGASSDPKPPKFTTGVKRLDIDISTLKAPLPRDRLVAMKEDIVTVLTAMGYHNVRMDPDESSR